MERINLKESFAFYAAYHRHPVNQLIHIITIPIIVLTILVWLSYGTIYQFEISQDSQSLNNLFSLNVGIIVIAMYLALYNVLKPFVGLLMSPFIMILYLLANIIRFEVPYAWAICIGFNILALILQFLGHSVWEKRKPNLMESLLQAFLMDPLFIFLGILFKLGFYKDFKDEIEQMQENFI